MKQNNHSIKNRFFASVLGNISKSGISFLTAILLAKWLGPEDYGRMVFLIGSFTAFIQLLNMSSSDAFFTFISKRQRSLKFIQYFWAWILIQFLFSLFLFINFLPESIIKTVWVGEKRELVVLAMIAAFMQQQVWNIASRMAEAQRETVRLQKLTVLVFLIHLITVVSLWFFGKLILPIIFVALIGEWLIASIVIVKVYKVEKHTYSINNTETIYSIFKEYWVYCLPLIPFVWFSFAHDFADYWMLQNWGGSKQQAYYSIANHIAAVSLLATTSILRILWKEISEAKQKGDVQRIKFLYKKATRMLYFFGAFLAGGLIPWSYEIINILLGGEYIGAVLTFSIMIFYPLHQSLGQINGTMLYATEKTRALSIIGLSFLSSSIIVSYMFLAPETLIVPGLNLGSEGLAIKMVVMQLIFVNIMGYSVAKLIGFKFDWFYQIIGIFLTCSFGYLCKIFIVAIISVPILAKIIFSSLLYTGCVAFIIYLMPWLIDVSRIELVHNSKKILSRINFLKN